MDFHQTQIRQYRRSGTGAGTFLAAVMSCFLLLTVLPVASFAQTGTVQGVADLRQYDDEAKDTTEDGEESAAVEEDADNTTDDPFMNMSLQDAYQRSVSVSQPKIDPQNMASMFYTPWQYSLLQEAKRGFRTRAPTQGDLDDDTPERKFSIREISLGGIVFKSDENWTIWLNGQRVTPETIPESVLDIDVGQRYVQMKWFDSYTNLIFPIRLRPHERFNLDTRIFLPGKGT